MDLADNIYVARIDRRSIVLDLNRDRYIGLDGGLSEALERVCSYTGEGRQISTEGERALTKLLHQGLLTSQGQYKYLRASNPAIVSQATIPQPTASLWALLSDEQTYDEPVSIADIISALASLIQVSISLRVRSFKSTISWISKAKVAVPRTQARCSLQTLVDAFYEIRPYFPIKRICRLDAPSLCLHLRRNGQDAKLVFGVRLDPFAAHCWVQIGECVIDEAWAVARQYTPILVV